MLDGSVKGFFLPGQNPAVGSVNGSLHRKAMANLDWLVVRDMTAVGLPQGSPRVGDRSAEPGAALAAELPPRLQR
jgi:hypothetical protein